MRSAKIFFFLLLLFASALLLAELVYQHISLGNSLSRTCARLRCATCNASENNTVSNVSDLNSSIGVYVNTAIVIPFRDRHVQLDVFLTHMKLFLKEQKITYKIFVVEQVKEKFFNRAKLMNVGFLEARKRFDVSCIVFHDVDLLPISAYTVYNCSTKGPVHLASAIDKFGFRLYRSWNFGGVCMFMADQFIKMNGFSNSFWGWGGEDDEAFLRIKYSQQKVQRWSPSAIKYVAISHDKDKNVNKDRFRLVKARPKDSWKTDGLNSLNYTVVAYKDMGTFIKITVRI